MKNKTYVLNTALAVVVTIALAICVCIRVFAPAAIIPELNIPNIALLSLIAVLADHYLAPGAKRCYLCAAVFSALTFGLLPYVAGFAAGFTVLKLALVGAAVFTLITFLFSSVQERLSSGPAAKVAPLLSAFGLYLAFQIFTGMIL
ncbi:MAG: hypothetical protein IJW14_00450 [Oscillospiraceae bacterium]|nr:hypothetical protein [Oscillospiraceae bacterium]